MYIHSAERFPRASERSCRSLEEYAMSSGRVTQSRKAVCVGNEAVTQRSDDLVGKYRTTDDACRTNV